MTEKRNLHADKIQIVTSKNKTLKKKQHLRLLKFI